MNAKNCTTHHYACDCREAKFAEIARYNETLREDLDNAHNTIRGMEVQEERLKLENAALKQQCETCETAVVIDSYVRENAALRAAIQRIKNEWAALVNCENELDDAICAAIDAARKEAKP